MNHPIRIVQRELLRLLLTDTEQWRDPTDLAVAADAATLGQAQAELVELGRVEINESGQIRSASHPLRGFGDGLDVRIEADIQVTELELIALLQADGQRWWIAYELKRRAAAVAGVYGSIAGLALRRLIENRQVERNAQLHIRWVD